MESNSNIRLIGLSLPGEHTGKGDILFLHEVNTNKNKNTLTVLSFQTFISGNLNVPIAISKEFDKTRFSECADKKRFENETS